MRFQFTLQTLLLSFVVIWSSMAAFGPGGLVLAAIILGVVGYLRRSQSMWRDTAIVGAILLCGLCLLGLWLVVDTPRDVYRQARCVNNLKQITLGLHNYHDAHGCFPPAYIADTKGKPMHSWRVLILPYMEQEALYDRYDFSEPWDGPNNRKLTGAKPYAYVCPSSDSNSPSGSPMTNYVAVIGQGAMWKKDRAVKVSEIPDGTSYTIMLAEIANSDINWMEPRDLSFEEALRGINPKSGLGISSQHVSNNGYFYHDTPLANVAFADATAHALPEGLSVEKLEGLLTVDGGETVNVDLPDYYWTRRYLWPRPRLNWTKSSGVVALVVSVILLLVRPRGREPAGPESSDAPPGKPGR